MIVKGIRISNEDAEERKEKIKRKDKMHQNRIEEADSEVFVKFSSQRNRGQRNI